MKRPFKYMSYLSAAGLLLCTMFFVSSCNKDEAKKTTVDITNPNAVAKSLKVENSTYVTGTLPSPSGGAAPVLDDFNDNTPLLSIQGSKIIVYSNLKSGSAAGFYVKIQGSDGYYKITSTLASGRLATKNHSNKKRIFDNARKQSEETPTFSLEVPENIVPGEFCVSYCVYDAQNLVSNIITQCVTVKALGGDNASFLTANKWKLKKYEGYYNDSLTDVDIVGVDNVYKYQAYISCGSGDSSAYVNVEEHHRTDYTNVTFSTNGAFGIDEQYYEKYLDYDASNCTPTYKEVTEPYSFVGAWSYDDATKMLVFLYNGNDNSDDDQYQTDAEQYKASIVDGNLILRFDYSETEYDIVTLEPKN